MPLSKSRKYNFVYRIIRLNDNASNFPICYSWIPRNGVFGISLIMLIACRTQRNSRDFMLIAFNIFGITNDFDDRCSTRHDNDHYLQLL